MPGIKRAVGRTRWLIVFVAVCVLVTSHATSPARASTSIAQRLRSAFIVPVAGGGWGPVREGRVATAGHIERWSPGDLRMLPDGTPLFVDGLGIGSRLVSVGKDGYLHEFPRPPGTCNTQSDADGVAFFAVTDRGAVVASTNCSTVIYGLEPGATQWQARVDLVADRHYGDEAVAVAVYGQFRDGSLLLQPPLPSGEAVA
jgi:hypothetical protein